MATIPDFQKDGLLPPGDYEVSFAELRGSVLVAGAGDTERYPNWDVGGTARRGGSLKFAMEVRYDTQ